MRGTVQDITERMLSQLELLEVRRAQQALSRCNQALIRASDEPTLPAQVCPTIVEVAGHLLGRAAGAPAT